MAKHNDKQKRRSWGEGERQAFADGARNKAQTFADRRKEANRKACRNFRWQG